jgi:hypothetical protein
MLSKILRDSVKTIQNSTIGSFQNGLDGFLTILLSLDSWTVDRTISWRCSSQKKRELFRVTKKISKGHENHDFFHTFLLLSSAQYLSYANNSEIRYTTTYACILDLLKIRNECSYSLNGLDEGREST